MHVGQIGAHTHSLRFGVENPEPGTLAENLEPGTFELERCASSEGVRGDPVAHQRRATAGGELVPTAHMGFFKVWSFLGTPILFREGSPHEEQGAGYWIRSSPSYAFSLEGALAGAEPSFSPLSPEERGWLCLALRACSRSCDQLLVQPSFGSTPPTPIPHQPTSLGDTCRPMRCWRPAR